MNYKDYITALQYNKDDTNKVRQIEQLYSAEIPSDVACIISNLNKTIFLDSDSFLRVLDYQEILDAEKDLNTEFVSRGIIPVIDLGENDYLSYDLSKCKWFKYNIVDDIGFAYKETLAEYNF